MTLKTTRKESLNPEITIIFVYNAKSGLFNSVTDYVHKIVSSRTYKCNLCAITYNNLGMKKQWKLYIQQLKLPTRFMHEDDFNKTFPGYSNISLPTILIHIKTLPALLDGKLTNRIVKGFDDQLTELLNSHDLNKITSQDVLIEQLNLRLKPYLLD